MGGKRFSWLHLTDFHFGLKGQKFLWPNLRQPFLEDLERLHKFCGPWQAVFFTGDLVQSGDPDEFTQMQADVLDRIWEKLAVLQSENPVLLAVPGNHDLLRPDKKIDDPARDTMLLEAGFSGIADKFWNNPAGSYRRIINDAFAAYENWWSSTPHKPKANLANGILAGDFAHTISYGELQIGVIGLNTTFLQLQEGNYEKRLVWDVRQLHTVCGGAIDDWVRKHNVCFLLTHQGPAWLTPSCEKEGRTEIAPAGRFVAHLFGHMHETDLQYIKSGGSEAVRLCQGPSVFGMEKFGEPPIILRTHGYAAGTIEFESQDARFRVWPRIAFSAPWRFAPDFEHAELEEDHGTKPDTFRMRAAKSKSVAPAHIAASTQASVSKSTFIAIPKQNWPEDLTPKGFEMPDSMLLRPESRIVRFSGLRLPLRDEIITWAVNPDQFIKLRLHAGEGGSGKTRLLIEVCEELERNHGWRAGFVDRAQSIDTEFPRLLKEGSPCLIVFDYAETRTTEIVSLVRTALGTKGASQLRLVLLAREGGDWWDHLADAAKNDQAVAAILRGVNTKAGPYRMARETIALSERPVLFHEAFEDFARFKKVPVPANLASDLPDKIFENPFFIHLAALATLRGQNTTDDKELLSMALGHERSYWRQLLNELGLGEEVLPAFEQAVAAVTLGGGRRTAKDARLLLSRVPRLRDLDASIRKGVEDGLKRLYPLAGGIGTLQPDLLGEALVAEALANDDELLDVTLDRENNKDQIRGALTVLTRLGGRVATEQRWLQLGLERFLAEISEEAMQVGMETGAPMPEIHASVLRDAERHDRRRAVDLLRAKLPEKTENLANLTIEVRRQALGFIEARKTGSAAKREIASFEAMSSLAYALHDRGGACAGCSSGFRCCCACGTRI